MGGCGDGGLVGFAVKLGLPPVPKGRPEQLMDFLVEIIVPRIAFYFAFRDFEETHGVRGVPINTTVVTRCIKDLDGPGNYSKMEHNTAYSDMDRIDLYALATTRIFNCVHHFESERNDSANDSEERGIQSNINPQFNTDEQGEQFTICMDLIRMIQRRRAHGGIFSKTHPNNNIPFHKLQKCMEGWKQQPNAIDFSNIDPSVGRNSNPKYSNKRPAEASGSGVEPLDELQPNQLKKACKGLSASSCGKRTDCDDEEPGFGQTLPPNANGIVSTALQGEFEGSNTIAKTDDPEIGQFDGNDPVETVAAENDQIDCAEVSRVLYTACLDALRSMPRASEPKKMLARSLEDIESHSQVKELTRDKQNVCDLIETELNFMRLEHQIQMDQAKTLTVRYSNRGAAKSLEVAAQEVAAQIDKLSGVLNEVKGMSMI